MSEPTWIWTLDLVIPSETGAGRRVLDQLLERLEFDGWNGSEIHAIHLAMEEALVNAIRHGNRSDSTKLVHVLCKLADRFFWTEIRDEGPGFNPDQIPDPTDPERLEIPSGRGLMLMRAFMSRVEFNAAGNCVVMEKARVSSPASAAG